MSWLVCGELGHGVQLFPVSVPFLLISVTLLEAINDRPIYILDIRHNV